MLLAERYDRGAVNWSRVLDRLGFSEAYRTLFAELNFSVVGQSICDLGTGCGDFAAALLETSGSASSLTLVDPSHKMLANAEQRLKSKCGRLHAYADRIETVDGIGKFDVVLGAHVLEHLKDPVEGLRKVYQLLKPGGRLVLSVSKPHICQWVIWLKWQHTWFSEQQVTKLLEATGFSAICVRPYPSGVPARCSLAYVAHRPPQNSRNPIKIG